MLENTVIYHETGIILKSTVI